MQRLPNLWKTSQFCTVHGSFLPFFGLNVRPSAHVETTIWMVSLSVCEYFPYRTFELSQASKPGGKGNIIFAAKEFARPRLGMLPGQVASVLLFDILFVRHALACISLLLLPCRCACTGLCEVHAFPEYSC